MIKSKRYTWKGLIMQRTDMRVDGPSEGIVTQKLWKSEKKKNSLRDKIINY